MDSRLLFFIASLVLAGSASATGTGPTLPEKSREHPLDNREPRHEVIDRQDEAPPEVAPQDPVERGLPADQPERRGSDAHTDNTPAS